MAKPVLHKLPKKKPVDNRSHFERYVDWAGRNPGKAFLVRTGVRASILGGSLVASHNARKAQQEQTNHEIRIIREKVFFWE